MVDAGELARAFGLIRQVPDFPEPGVLFRDLTPMLADPAALRAVTDGLADAISSVPGGTELIAAVEARGFLLGAVVAARLGIGVVPVRKPGKLPVVADRIDYALEYGTATLELPADTVRPGRRVAVVDDVLATGGTVDATCRLLDRAGAEITAVAVLLELAALGGRDRLSGREVVALHTV